jgi:hypothetical protein
MPVSQITNYADLQEALLDLLDRSDLATQAPQFIQMAESYINRRLRHWKMETKTIQPGFADTDIVVPPTDMLEARNITAVVEGENYQLTYQSPDVIDMESARYVNDDEPDHPLFFTLAQGHIQIWPVPDVNFNLLVDHYQVIPALHALGQTGTNWLLADAPDAYLYGAAVHSAPFLDDDERIALWQRLFDVALGELQQASNVARYSGSRLTRRPPLRFG